MSIQKWLRDIDQAIEELKAMSAIKRVSVLGLRFGATLAATATRDRKDVEDLLLWDPVVAGAEYLDELRKIHAQMLIDPDRFAIPRSNDESTNEELLGFGMPAKLTADIRAGNLDSIDNTRLRRLCVIDSQRNKSLKSLGDADSDGKSKFEYVEVEADLHWDDPAMIEIALMPNEVIELIATRLAK